MPKEDLEDAIEDAVEDKLEKRFNEFKELLEEFFFFLLCQGRQSWVLVNELKKEKMNMMMMIVEHSTMHISMGFCPPA